MQKRPTLHSHLWIEDVLKLFHAKLEIRIKRSSLYYYIGKHGFPKPRAFGCPKRWDKKEVMRWFAAKINE